MQNPIKKEILDDFRSMNETELLNKYFRAGNDWLELKKKMIEKLKHEISESESMKLGKKALEFTKPASVSQYSYLLFPAVYFSVYEPDGFEDNMNELLPPNSQKTVLPEWFTAPASLAAAIVIMIQEEDMIQAAPAVRAAEADALAKKQSNWIAFLFFKILSSCCFGKDKSRSFPFIINLLKLRH
ncbi:hypothetical protein M5V91_08435 [Cytobacillus pseudoceanisediminis]|uniref:hypothetical protein n=1 Tax=Cytobacillus pseudoceanisediminis TaxID=3051614 RepID=UPI00218C07EB|nr:hypothetical protein [Cytobacillus pseudoceanisediminis]UQX55671.1 hypothetical protein M5V91_08435 [Cytobacillus pseudoceanisediminis]